MDIKGYIVTIDAMGCQAAIADMIIEGEADYPISLKGNQSNLHEDVVLFFDDLLAGFTAYAYDYAHTVDKGHGRIEIRRCWTIDYPNLVGSLRCAGNWRNLNTLVKVQSERRIDGKRTIEERYFIASYQDSSRHMLEHTRKHWHVENSLHWVLDIAFREDKCSIRKGNGPQNFAVLRLIPHRSQPAQA